MYHNKKQQPMIQIHDIYKDSPEISHTYLDKLSEYELCMLQNQTNTMYQGLKKQKTTLQKKLLMLFLFIAVLLYCRSLLGNEILSITCGILCAAGGVFWIKMLIKYDKVRDAIYWPRERLVMINLYITIEMLNGRLKGNWKKESGPYIYL